MASAGQERAYRDPVHDFITITNPLLLAIIDTPEFQRLRRIRQLGATYGTYHGAEHSRFGHSLGVFWIMRKVLHRLQTIGVRIDTELKIIAYTSALLHDIGHGPYSHALEEHITPGIDHEQWTKRIVMGDTEVHRILSEYDPKLPEYIVAIIDGTWQGPRFIHDLVTSQLDTDRMDYLIRDALYTGVTYGHYDLERLINMLTVVNDEIVLMPKGIVPAEEYILARYYMYWQVYFHKTTRGQEHMMRQIWRRAVYLTDRRRLRDEFLPPPVNQFLQGRGTLAAYLALDDTDVLYAMKRWARHDDVVLRDLSQRFLHRTLLKAVFKTPHESFPHEKLDVVRDIVRHAGWDPRYYVVVDRTSDVAYDYYTKPSETTTGERQPIVALDEHGVPREIATLSHTISALATQRKVAVNVYVPEDCVEHVRRLFGVG